MTLRSDVIVRDLLAGLDRRIGAGNYFVGLSSDHGICSFPELASQRGLDARRIDPGALTTQARKHLNAYFGIADEKTNWFDKQIWPWLYLNRKMIEARGLSQSSVAIAVADWIRMQPWALEAYTRQQLSGPMAEDDTFGRMMQRSFHPDRSGDVAMIAKPNYLMYSTRTGTGHNSPHPYDTHVPLMIMGAGVIGGRSAQPITPQAMAAILSRAAGIPPPAMADTPAPELVRPQ
jgi:hypothetical protein